MRELKESLIEDSKAKMHRLRGRRLQARDQVAKALTSKEKESMLQYSSNIKEIESR